MEYDEAWEKGVTPDYIDPVTEQEGSRTRVVSAEHLMEYEPKHIVQ